MELIKPTKEQIIKEYWFRGNLGYKLHTGQKYINQTLSTLKGQLVVINCSRQWGKTYLMVTKAIELALKQPKARIKIGTAFLTDLTEFILPTFDTVLLDCPPSLKPKYKVQGSKWVFSNGSEIKLVGLDKHPNSLRGNSKTSMVILDEAGFIGNLDYIYKSVLIPMTTHSPDCKIILISTPPSTPAHPYVEFAQRAESEGSYCKFDVYTNPMIDQATVNRLAKESGGYDSTTWKREYLCQFVLDQDLALVREWDDKYIEDTKPDEFRPFYHNYVAMDMGRKDKTALLFGYYDFRNARLIIEDELTMDGPTWTTLTLKDDILVKEKELWKEKKVYLRIADNNNPHLIQDLSNLHNLTFSETNKESLEAMVNEVRIMVGQGRILINPKCKMLIGCLKYGIWDKNRKEFARSKVYGHFDWFAALVYLVRNLDTFSNPIPANYGHTQNTWSPKFNTDSHQTRIAKQIFNIKK